ncbi:MAG: pantoate--beta-alanine ligase [Pseudomonadales bacterium]
MQTAATVKALRSITAKARQDGLTIGFVPTMGNLHDGHLKLVRQARNTCDFVIVSIFVNPLQFGPNEDLAAYPRTLAADKEKLFAEGTNLLFAPSVDEMYPGNPNLQTQVTVPEISNTLCGAVRPGHFTGVATVVSKLFNMVQPDTAIFGKKDFQQLLVIRRMVNDLSMPIEIVGVDTARSDDGLALSSRNGYLNSHQRTIAPRLHKILQDYRGALASGFDNYAELEHLATADLYAAGFRPDYFSIKDASTLAEVTPETEEVVILTAAMLGNTRLIDNVTLALNPVSDWGMLAVN